MGGFPDHSNHLNKMGVTHVTAKYRDYSNPFKVAKKKKDPHFHSSNTIANDYLIQGKKANYN